jgi:hypothetical protein
MLEIYFTQIAKFVSDLLPPKKRTDYNKSLLAGLLGAWNRRSLDLYDFKRGSAYSTYSAGTYNKYDLVIFNNGAYECWVDGTTTDPTDTAAWKLLNANFIGSTIAQNFNGNKIVLEYALNYWFSTSFSNPPVLSEIYLTNNTLTTPAFRSGITESVSSSSGIDTSSEFVPLSYTAAAQPANFAINVPIAFYTALGANAEQIIRDFADKYVATSITYEIITY